MKYLSILIISTCTLLLTSCGDSQTNVRTSTGTTTIHNVNSLTGCLVSAHFHIGDHVLTQDPKSGFAMSGVINKIECKWNQPIYSTYSVKDNFEDYDITEREMHLVK